MSAPIVREPRGIIASHVECPTCHAWVGWGCDGQGHVEVHRTRLRAELKRLGFIERRARVNAAEFFYDLNERRYYDLVPGYRCLYVRRETATPFEQASARCEDGGGA